VPAAEPPSGQQIEIRHGRQRAVVVEVGGGLRAYAVDGLDVLDGYPAERIADGGRGQPLLPWPNRLADGQYVWDGTQLQLPVDELGRRNASHGLTRWLNWSVAGRSDDRVCMSYLLHPRPGYPFTLGLEIDYQLSDAGLSVRTTAHNRGAHTLPYGAGFHPYLSVGTGRIDSAVLTLPARTVLDVDERMLPTGTRQPVAGTDLDFTTPRPIGEQSLDHCFTDLERDADGVARVVLSTPDGDACVTLWLDSAFDYLQVFSGDTLARDRRRQGLAVEPMTCPPNAFGSGVDVVRLEPDQRHTSAWGLALTKRGQSERPE
jgi:aldose 1-epimerase